MNKIAFGQYYPTDSIIHRLDPRVKILVLIMLLVALFLIPRNNFIVLGGFALLILITVFLSKVPVIKFMKSLKQVAFLLLFSFVFQVLFNQSGRVIGQVTQVLTLGNLLIALALLIGYFLIRKYLKLKFLCLLLVIALVIYIMQYPLFGFTITTYQLVAYEDGLLTGVFIIGRIFILLTFSSMLTLTTKPMALNNGLEALLKPLEKLKIKTSIFAMMLSIALRFIPTLFIEADKILKAQAARGVDFTEGKLKDKIIQITSLLVPMFVISFKRAEELADAMEARGYVPGAKRSKLEQLYMHFSDYLVLLLCLLLLAGLIVWRVI